MHLRIIMLCVTVLSLIAAAPARAQATRRTAIEVEVRYSDGSSETVPPRAKPPTPEPSAQRPRVQPSLGINLNAPSDWDPSKVFIDAMKTARRFGSTTRPFDESSPVTANGWPTADAGVRVLTDVPSATGTYKLIANGKFDLGANGGTVANLRYDASRNVSTADVEVRAPIATLELVFTGTGGRLRNVKLLRPNYADDSELFTREFLHALDPFSAIRFMDWLRTNDSLVTRWDQRGRLEQATWRNLAPYEICLRLGVRTKKAIWLTVPALANDDYVRRLGDVIRALVPSDGPPVYVEYSNELWNGQFKQFGQNLDATVAEVAAGEKTLNLDGTDANRFYWTWRRVAKRSIEIKQLLGPHPQLRMVLCSQVGYGSKPAEYGFVLRKQLEYVERYYGPPSRFFFAVAGAPYFSPGKDETDPTGKTWYTQRNDLTPETLAQRLVSRADAGAHARAFHSIAEQYALASFAYEGGLDLQQFPNMVDVKIASQYHPAAGAAVERYINSWWDGGGSVMFYFVLASRYSKNGYWGLTEDVRELTTPKYQGAIRAARRATTLPAK